MTDEQAMRLVQSQSDQNAFARLVARWKKPILNLCTRTMGDPHRGEDLTQETFARVFVRRGDYIPEARFSTWLWRIALNLCYSELRKLRRHPAPTIEHDIRLDEEAESELQQVCVGPDALVATQEEARLIQRALLQLPEGQRLILLLRYSDGLKVREIAQRLGIPETTAGSRCATALAKLKRIVEAKPPVCRLASSYNPVFIL